MHPLGTSDSPRALGSSKLNPWRVPSLHGVAKKAWPNLERPIRVIVVDDTPAMLQSASSLLSKLPALEVVGQARTGREAIDLVNRLRPDLVIMDVCMPEMGGLEATRRLLLEVGAPKVILMSNHEPTEYRKAAEEAGAISFVSKLDLVDVLPPLIQSLYVEPKSEEGEATTGGDKPSG